MPVLVSSPQPTVPVTPPDPVTQLPPIDRWNYDERFPGLDSVTWTGWDASTWELWCRNPHDLHSGVVLGRRVRGLHFGELEEWTQESPAVDGASYLGYRAKPREVFLNLRVFKHTSSQEWIEHDRRFWRSMMPVLPGVRGPGRLTVAQPNGETRWLDLWPTHKGDVDFDVDPSRRGWASYGQYLTAYQPWWTSQALPARRFSAGGSSGFFGGATGGRGAPFVIGSSAQFGAAVIDNPGDEYSWPVWMLYGPFEAARIGTPGQLSELKVTVAAGDWLRVDTDPLAQTVVDSTGTARIPTQIAGAPFAPIPPGVNVPLVAEMTGAGSIEVTVQPRYHRAW